MFPHQNLPNCLSYAISIYFSTKNWTPSHLSNERSTKTRHFLNWAYINWWGLSLLREQSDLNTSLFNLVQYCEETFQDTNTYCTHLRAVHTIYIFAVLRVSGIEKKKRKEKKDLNGTVYLIETLKNNKSTKDNPPCVRSFLSTHSALPLLF